MRLGRLLPGGLLALLVACGSETVTTEPGALVITLNGPPPSLTNAGILQISGQVTRTPAADVPIVVTATGGPNAESDTAAADGSFALSVGLTLNAQNTLTISAADESGSSVTPVSLEVRHDALPPQVSSMTPAHESDLVTPATVSLLFTEPVRPGSATLAVTLQGTPVGGTTALSNDSLTLTFTPAVALAANAIHAVTVAGAQDGLGNTLSNASFCFTTGGAGIASFSDPTGVFFAFGAPPPSLIAPDVVELRFARTVTDLYGIVRFTSVRSLVPTVSNNTSLWIDFDVDQDGGTGFVTFKDTVLSGLVASSGAGAEYVVAIGTILDVPGDSAFVGQYQTQTQLQGALFVPSVCGRTIGFAFPFVAIGGDDGAFDIVSYADVFVTAGLIVDPAPDTGVYSVTVTAAADARAAGPPVASLGRPVIARRRPVSSRPR
jgi:hypothetical protein